MGDSSQVTMSLTMRFGFRALNLVVSCKAPVVSAVPIGICDKRFTLCAYVTNRAVSLALFLLRIVHQVRLDILMEWEYVLPEKTNH
jgi:hypothetical protein